MMWTGTVPLRAVRPGTIGVHADREGVDTLDPMHKARLPQRVQRPIDGLRPTHPSRLKTRQDLIGGQGLPGRSAQHAEHQVLIA